MAKSVKIEMNNAGIRELLTSSGIESLLSSQASRMAASAGEGYAVVMGSAGKTRSRAWVQTDTPDAMEDNARNATLLRALGGG